MSGSKLFSASQASILYERGPGSNEAAGRIRVWRAKYELPGVKHHLSKGLLPYFLLFMENTRTLCAPTSLSFIIPKQSTVNNNKFLNATQNT